MILTVMRLINRSHFIDIYLDIQHPWIVFLLIYRLQLAVVEVFIVFLVLKFIHLWALVVGLVFGFGELSLEVGDLDLVLLDFLLGVFVGGRQLVQL